MSSPLDILLWILFAPWLVLYWVDVVLVANAGPLGYLVAILLTLSGIIGLAIALVTVYRDTVTVSGERAGTLWTLGCALNPLLLGLWFVLYPMRAEQRRAAALEQARKEAARQPLGPPVPVEQIEHPLPEFDPQRQLREAIAAPSFLETLQTAQLAEDFFVPWLHLGRARRPIFTESPLAGKPMGPAEQPWLELGMHVDAALDPATPDHLYEGPSPFELAVEQVLADEAEFERLDPQAAPVEPALECDDPAVAASFDPHLRRLYAYGDYNEVVRLLQSQYYLRQFRKDTVPDHLPKAIVLVRGRQLERELDRFRARFDELTRAPRPEGSA